PFFVAAALPFAAAVPVLACQQTASAKIAGTERVLRYCVIDGMAVLGDMQLGEHAMIQWQGFIRMPVTDWRRAQADQRRNASEPGGRRGKRHIGANAVAGYGASTWPRNTLMFAFAPSATARTQAAIREAMRDIEQDTHVRFKERDKETDYVVIETRPVDPKRPTLCGEATVGRLGGPQTLFLVQRPPSQRTCETPGVARHELQHALGFFHEDIDRGHLGLTRREIAAINAYYPAGEASGRRMPRPETAWNVPQLVIDQGGLGQAQLRLGHPALTSDKMVWRDEYGNALPFRTIIDRTNRHHYTLTVKPGSFHGVAKLSLTLADADGQAVQAPALTLRVAPRRQTSAHPASQPERQLVSRYGGNRCLQAPPALSADTRLKAAFCRPGEPLQQWRALPAGLIESTAHAGHCLTPSPHNAGATLSPCQPNTAGQHWRLGGNGNLISGGPGQPHLSIDGGLGVQALAPVRNATWQRWDWR
ncbi:MAG: ricin-type beta-trefoil lectin domain protein, partial [Paludibacterium sp.]